MNENELIINLLTSTYKKSESYFKNDVWSKGRCRIDASFYVSIMIDYYFKKDTTNNINEYYLNETRIINRKRNLTVKDVYSNSHGMDINSLKQLLKFGSFGNPLKDNLGKYGIQKVQIAIRDYINVILKNMNKETHQTILKEWDSYYLSLFTNNTQDYRDQFSKIAQEKELEVLDITDLKKGTVEYIPIIQKTSSPDNNSDYFMLTQECGEQLVYKHLIKQYGEMNVNWVSSKNKYSNYDFEVNINNQVKYIEVKSTTESSLSKFFISRSKYAFYQEQSENYYLYFVSNIKRYDEGNLYTPNLIVINAPKIEISFDKTGYDFENNKILITPYKFIANW